MNISTSNIRSDILNNIVNDSQATLTTYICGSKIRYNKLSRLWQ